jgi:hypothetical protein
MKSSLTCHACLPGFVTAKMMEACLLMCVCVLVVVPCASQVNSLFDELVLNRPTYPPKILNIIHNPYREIDMRPACIHLEGNTRICNVSTLYLNVEDYPFYSFALHVRDLEPLWDEEWAIPPS